MDILVYDSECGFCTEVAERACERASYELVAFEELSHVQRKVLPENHRDCAHVIEDDTGIVYSCGDAARHVVKSVHPCVPLSFTKAPLIRLFWDIGYKLIAANRRHAMPVWRVVTFVDDRVRQFVGWVREKASETVLHDTE